MNFQALIDGMNAQAQRERAGTQLTLGGLIAALEAMPDGVDVANLFYPHSYRGYYCDLALERAEGTRPAAGLLADCRAAMGETFQGWKGGDYMMGKTTPLWVSEEGTASGLKLMSVLPGGEIVTEVDDA